MNVTADTLRRLNVPVFYPAVLDQHTTDEAQGAKEQEPHLCRHEEKGGIQPLTDLCCLSIVLDSTTTLNAIKCCPSDVFISLMRAALLLDRDAAQEVLLNHWPHKYLVIHRLLPNFFKDLRYQYNPLYQLEQIRRSVKFTTTLGHTFIECLKKRSPTKLQYLDLSGFPTAEIIMNYLSSHALLAFNEQKQNEIIDLYNRAVQVLPIPMSEQYARGLTLPTDQVAILLDAHISQNSTHLELCRAMKSWPNTTFHIVLKNLSVVSQGTARVVVLLEQLDPEQLNGLSIPFNRLDLNCLDHLLPIFEKFVNLQALDFSNNDMKLSTDNVAVERLRNALAGFQQLRRLNFSNNRLRRKISRLIPTSLRLTHLSLASCWLVAEDFNAIKLLMPTLQALDLSCNALSTDERLSAFGSTVSQAPQLLVLEIEDCQLQKIPAVGALPQFLQDIPKLRYLNIADNSQGIDAAGSVLFLTFMMDIFTLKVVRLSVPADLQDVSESRHQYLSMIYMMLKTQYPEMRSDPLTVMVPPEDSFHIP